MAVATPSVAGASLPSLGSASLVINKPTGTVSGDWLYCFINLSANQTITPPAGWTTLVNVSGVKLYEKQAGGSEPASYTFTRGLTTNTILGTMIRVTGARASSSPLQPSGIAAQAAGTGTTVVLPTLTVTTGVTLIQIAHVHANTSFTPPAAPTEQFDATYASESFAGAVGIELVAPGVTGSRTWTAGTSGQRSGVMLALVGADQTISPGGVDSSATVGAPTVTAGPVTASPTGIDSTATIGTPAVSAGVALIEPPGIDSSATLGTPTVTASWFTVFPDGVDSGAIVGTPEVQPQMVVSGTVFNHETGSPVGAGVVVKLFDDADVLIDSILTDGAGGFIFYRPFGDTDLYWTYTEYEIAGVQYHGVSDRGCPAI